MHKNVILHTILIGECAPVYIENVYQSSKIADIEGQNSKATSRRKISHYRIKRTTGPVGLLENKERQEGQNIWLDAVPKAKFTFRMSKESTLNMLSESYVIFDSNSNVYPIYHHFRYIHSCSLHNLDLDL